MFYQEDLAERPPLDLPVVKQFLLLLVIPFLRCASLSVMNTYVGTSSTRGISFHKQETRFSCVPACLRMVLLSFGIDITEGELRVRCDSTILGTNALRAVDAARQLGFVATGKFTLTPDELKSLVAAGRFPIVFVSIRPIDARDDLHALVVTEFRQHDVLVLDPLSGERAISSPTFNAAWGMRHNLAILIER